MATATKRKRPTRSRGRSNKVGLPITAAGAAFRATGNKGGAVRGLARAAGRVTRSATASAAIAKAAARTRKSKRPKKK